MSHEATHLPFIMQALTQRVRVHCSNKPRSRAIFYQIMRENEINTIRIFDGPDDQLWLLPKESKGEP